MHDHWCMETRKNIKYISTSLSLEDSLWTTTTSRIWQVTPYACLLRAPQSNKYFSESREYLPICYCVDGQTWKRRNDQNIGFLLLRQLGDISNTQLDLADSTRCSQRYRVANNQRHFRLIKGTLNLMSPPYPIWLLIMSSRGEPHSIPVPKGRGGWGCSALVGLSLPDSAEPRRCKRALLLLPFSTNTRQNRVCR